MRVTVSLEHARALTDDGKSDCLSFLRGASKKVTDLGTIRLRARGPTDDA